MLINLHTHQTNKNALSILNILAGKEPLPDWDLNQYYSIGFHPWYLEKYSAWKDIIEKTAHLPIIRAIGECGLDKNSIYTLTQQTDIFCWQINLAETLKKPLIIHCVKAYNELFKLKKEIKTTIPWIIHGFNASESIMRLCIQNGFYFSLGHQLCNTNSNINKLSSIIPRGQVFLETDENITPIEEIYAQYSLITGIPEDEVEKAIYANFVSCFKQADL
jgi:TatD DNase family protein